MSYQQKLVTQPCVWALVLSKCLGFWVRWFCLYVCIPWELNVEINHSPVSAGQSENKRIC